MRYRLFLFIKRMGGAHLLSAALVVTGAVAQESAAPPDLVHTALPSAQLWGQGQMRFLGLRIYDARLWAGPQFEAAQFSIHPLALELSYRRAFTSAAIAQRSIDEIARQGDLAPAQAEIWLQALRAVLPDVQPGDRLTGLYQPGQGLRLWRGNQLLGGINDAELARRFFGIWLSPHTSEPGLRSALLARTPGAGQ